MRLQVAFFDSGGIRIERIVVDLEEALAKIAVFVTRHGTDPDENGKNAMAGRIEFTPIED